MVKNILSATLFEESVKLRRESQTGLLKGLKE